VLLFVERVEAYHAIQRKIEERRRHRGCYGRDGMRVDFKGKVLIVQRQSERLDRRSSIAIGKIEHNFGIDWSRRPINRSFIYQHLFLNLLSTKVLSSMEKTFGHQRTNASHRLPPVSLFTNFLSFSPFASSSSQFLVWCIMAIRLWSMLNADLTQAKRAGGGRGAPGAE